MANHKNNNLSKADYLDFEESVAEIDRQINELTKLSSAKGIDYSAEILSLQKKQVEQLELIYSNLSAWQTVQVARHSKRPLLNDYLRLMVNDFQQLHGDRCFGDDKALIAGLGKIGTEKVLIVGHNKGKSTQEKITCNFGCANPEGYRKAICKMRFAAKFNLPIVSFIDTPGAYPGIGAEERGQAQAIAANLMEMSTLAVPIICIVIGEGGSGGALGVGVGDRLAMLEFAYYSVISPEGCAAILWRDGSQAKYAAEALRLTSKELLRLGLIDSIISEPLGGAHRNIHDTIDSVANYITRTLYQLKRLGTENLLTQRYQKLRRLGEPLSVQLERKTAPAKQKVVAALKGVSSKAKLSSRTNKTPDFRLQTPD